MDAANRPLLVPPDFATYAEKNGIFDMYKVSTVDKIGDADNICLSSATTTFAGACQSLSLSVGLSNLA